MSFYYVAKDKNRVFERPYNVVKWLAFFQNKCIGHSIQKRAHKRTSQRVAVVSPVHLDDDDNDKNIINDSETHELDIILIGPVNGQVEHHSPACHVLDGFA